MKIVQDLKVKNVFGLHARPAGVIAGIAVRSKSSVKIMYKNESVDARSLIRILVLAVHGNDSVTFTIEGDDAQETLAALTAAFENKFGEP